MPRNRWTPERDAPLLDAVFDPKREQGFAPMTRTQIRDVRAVYVEGLGWSRERLAQYRFRLLAATARREGEIVTVKLKAPAEVVPTVRPDLLEQQLAHMSALPYQQAMRHFQDFFLARPEIDELMDHYRIKLSKSDYAAAQQLAAALGLPFSKSDAREGNEDLSLALAKIIEVARERLLG